jgi:hypothetical protein
MTVIFQHCIVIIILVFTAERAQAVAERKCKKSLVLNDF